MDQLEKLKAQEAELEAQMLGNQEPEDGASATEGEGVQQTEDEVQAAEWMEEHIVSDQEQPLEPEEELQPEPQPEKKSRTNWKKRFTNFKASADATMYEQRQEISRLQAQIAELAQAVHQAKSEEREVQGDIFDGVFTAEDEETFGSDGMAVVKKAAQSAVERTVNPLKEQLKRSEEARLAEAARVAKESQSRDYQEFLSRLSQLAPDYAELNADQGFLDWLSQPDDFSGLPRKTLLRNAEKMRDVGRVADFFIAYNSSKNAVRTGPSPEARKRMMPTGTGGAAQPQPKQQDVGYLRKSEIDKFYSDVMKGRYRGQDDVIKATEEAINSAYSENRILYGE